MPNGVITPRSRGSKSKGILAPPQVTITFRGNRPVGAVGIRTGMPEHPYVPADPGRRERLLQAIREINESRTRG
jgi:hypothetical protein